MENMFQKANLFNQCLSSWASKTQTVKTNFMFSSTKCPNLNSTPDENQGPWCQSATQGCDIPLGVIPLEPSNSPSSSQIASDVPSIDPSVSPSFLPSSSQLPSVSPSADPSLKPSYEPSTALSVNPSAKPSLQPSVGTSSAPSTSVSAEPSDSPSVSDAPSNSPTVDCSDEEQFRFKVKKNKAGIIKDLGGCSDYVAENPKKRCRKKILGKLVAFSCPVTCRKCTCKDQEKVTFKIKFGSKKKKKVTKMCKNLDRGKYCRIPNVQFACPTRCRVEFCEDTNK